MNKKEKIQRAKLYMDYLARGFNPITEEPVRNDDIVRNERISRCFMFVSEILGEVLENGIDERNFSYEKQRKAKKKDFTITDEEKANFRFSDNPLTVTEIANGLSSLVDGYKINSIKGVTINEWLMNNGFLTEKIGYNNKKIKTVTEEGSAIGIFEVERISDKGFPYKRILYKKSAQEFIIDNLDAVVEYNSVRSTVMKAKKEERRQLKKPAIFGNILDEIISDLYAAGATAQEIAETTEQTVSAVSERMRILGLK